MPLIYYTVASWMKRTDDRSCKLLQCIAPLPLPMPVPTPNTTVHATTAITVADCRLPIAVYRCTSKKLNFLFPGIQDLWGSRLYFLHVLNVYTYLLYTVGERLAILSVRRDTRIIKWIAFFSFLNKSSPQYTTVIHLPKSCEGW